MIGRLIGSYRVVRKLGEGGMGTVYEAVHEKLERRAAIKVLHPEVSKNAEVAARFFNEARAVNIIDHPGLIEIYEFGHLAEQGGAAYIVMEFLKGESLSLRLQRSGGRLVEAEAVRLSRQVASALLAAHKKFIVHRDLKPDNVFIVPDPEAPGGERAKVLDFGIAKLAEKNQEPGGEHVKTRTGMLMGTPAYMSPEQCRGAGGVDARSDVYSLGVMMYQMLTGQLPFNAEGLGDLLVKHITEPPRPIWQLAPETSAELAALVHRMLAKTPQERVTMDQVVSELTRLGGGQSQPPVPLPAQSQVGVPVPPVHATGTVLGSMSSFPAAHPPPGAPVPPRQPLEWTRVQQRPMAPAVPVLVLALLIGVGAWRFWPRARKPPALVSAQQSIASGSISVPMPVLPPHVPVEVREQLRQAQETATRARAAAERLAAGLPEEGRQSLMTEAGVQETLAAFQQRLGGPVKALKLVLYAQYAILSAQVPGEPDHIDQYTYRNGQVGNPEPVRVGGLILRDSLEDHLFPLSEVDPKVVPKLAQEALDRIGLPDGRVTHLIIEWDRTFTKRKVIRIYVIGKRGGGMLTADFRGKVLRVLKD